MLVTDAEIDALVAEGWDWHSAYRHLQAAAHAKAASSMTPIDNQHPNTSKSEGE